MKNLINKLSKFKVIFLLIIILIYMMYIYYYYGNLNINSFINHTVGSINILGKYTKYIFDSFINDSSVFKTILIIGAIIYISKYIDLYDYIRTIGAFEGYGIKFSREAAEKQKEKERENIEKLKEESDNDDTIKSAEKRAEIIELIIDNENIVALIEKYIRRARSFSIPLNLIPSKYKLETLGKIFDYKMHANTIKIISIRKDIEPILIDVYKELKDNSIIYCES